MNASSWVKVRDGAIRRLRTRRSDRLELVSHGDRGGYWDTIYAIAPAYEIARADAAELVRYLRLAAPATPGRGQGEAIVVGAGGMAAGTSRFIEVGAVTRPELDAAIDDAMRTALALTVFDLH